MTYRPPSIPPYETVDQLRVWLEEEFRTIATAMTETTTIDLRPINRAPDKPRDGMIIYADGTNFDPGAGEGVYGREGGAWVKL